MRAREFVTETRKKSIIKNGKKPHGNYEASLPGAHRVAGGNDRMYDLNRVMMAVAATDGIERPPVSDGSWAARTNLATPYTREEAEMLKMAYKMANVEWDDVLSPNNENSSQEPVDTDVKSPVQAFKGYPR
jgi:hypothetical protein